MRHLLTALTILTIALLGSAPSDKPPLPFEDFGACPFECCTYRDWNVNASTVLHQRRDPSSPVAFSVKLGEVVRGLTGVVVTEALGEIAIQADVDLEPMGQSVTARPGEIAYVLHYLGEGSWLLWFHGKTVPHHIPSAGSSEESPNTQPLRLVREPKVTWWVLIEGINGQLGWSSEPGHFGNVDACG
jgi:hypothetical protein